MSECRWIVLLLLAWSLGGCAPSTKSTPHLVEEHWPDGRLHIRRSVVTNWRGEVINDGPLEVWYENGQQRSLGHWKNGIKDGPFIYWHENGQQKMKLRNVDGRAHGRVQEWSADGKLIRDEQWRDGKRVAN